MGRECKTETAPRAPLVALALFFSLLLLVSLCLLFSFAMANAVETRDSTPSWILSPPPGHPLRPLSFSAASFLLVVGSWRWLVGGDGGPARLGTLRGESSADWLPGPERRRPFLSVAAPLSNAKTACNRLAIRMAEEVSEEESEEAEEEEEEDREEES